MKILSGVLMILVFSFSAFSKEARLSDLIPDPFYKKDTSGLNTISPIIDGYVALQIRLDMIRRAKKNIEVEYFIYNTDLAGKILTKELIKASQRGVKVRILIDKSKPIFEFNEYYARELAKHQIEVRYYNSSPLILISSVQFRNHRKLMSVDDKEAITGGRNIGDDYFDISHEFNFEDTDIYVKGPVAKMMRESFDAFFDNKISQRPDIDTLKDRNKIKDAEDFFLTDEREIEIRKRIKKFATQKLKSLKMYRCPELTYVTDAPGAKFSSRLRPDYDEKFKFVRKVLFDKLNEVDKRVLFSSPYLLVNRHSNKLMKVLLDKKVDITVYTNSLASTDAIYVASNLYFDVYKWVRKDIKVHLHDGKFTNINEDVEDEVKKSRWGTHSKVQVYESSKFTEAMIGTYNIDNRSNFYNAEMAIFCRGNDEFTAHVKKDIIHSIHHGIQIHSNGTASDRNGNKKDVFGSSRKGLVIMNLIFLPSWLLKFLL